MRTLLVRDEDSFDEEEEEEEDDETSGRVVTGLGAGGGGREGATNTRGLGLDDEDWDRTDTSSLTGLTLNGNNISSSSQSSKEMTSPPPPSKEEDDGRFKFATAFDFILLHLSFLDYTFEFLKKDLEKEDTKE